MISIIHVSARPAHCFTFHPEWNQYDRFGQSCDAQTRRDFEVIAVTPYPMDARHRARANWTVVEPRESPWRSARTFAVANALNTGIVHARGDWCIVMCDAAEMSDKLVERVAEHAERGSGLAILTRREDGSWCDTRAAWLDEHGDAQGRAYLGHLGAGPLPQGLLSFPLELALRVNGYDSHFDGGRGLEDVDYSYRLMQAGLSFVLEKDAWVTIRSHRGYEREVISEEAVRCCNPTWVIARERNQVRANAVAYTPSERRRVLECCFWIDGKCGYYRAEHACAYPWAEHGHPIARRIMIDEGEPLFDLASERSRQ